MVHVVTIDADARGEEPALHCTCGWSVRRKLTETEHLMETLAREHERIAD